MTKLYVPMTDEEFVALSQMANRECRHPREQIRYLLQKELVRNGMLVEKVNTGAEGLGNHTPVLLESTP